MPRILMQKYESIVPREYNLLSTDNVLQDSLFLKHLMIWVRITYSKMAYFWGILWLATATIQSMPKRIRYRSYGCKSIMFAMVIATQIRKSMDYKTAQNWGNKPCQFRQVLISVAYIRLYRSSSILWSIFWRSATK